MASTNFLPFDPNKENVMGDTEYNSSQQRLNGVQGGIASSKLHNKSMIQTSLVAAAIAQYMVSAGYDALDTDTVAGFADKLKQSILANQTGLAKATTKMVEEGTDDTAYITSYLLKHFYDYWRATREQGALQSDNTHYITPQVMHANKPWKEIARLTTSGTYTVPDGVYKLGVFAMGAGMGGGVVEERSGREYWRIGAASGFIATAILDVIPGQKISYTIAAKTPGYSGQSGEATQGGDTTFGTLKAYGGRSLRSALQSMPEYFILTGNSYNTGNLGYTCATQTDYASGDQLYKQAPALYNPFVSVNTSNVSISSIVCAPENCRRNPFDPSLTFGAAGAAYKWNETEGFVQNQSIDTDLGHGGAVGQDATGYGNGGGTARAPYNSTATGGSGSQGIVILYA